MAPVDVHAADFFLPTATAVEPPPPQSSYAWILIDKSCIIASRNTGVGCFLQSKKNVETGSENVARPTKSTMGWYLYPTTGVGIGYPFHENNRGPWVS
eukprot:scaffold2088_cov86-Skeletonema_dohrnii-CCMP3373.AAC.1